MMMPSSTASMSVPSYWFRIKKTGACHKVYQPHRDGIHLQMEYDLRWYTLEELEPITEEEFEDWKESQRAISRAYREANA